MPSLQYASSIVNANGATNLYATWLLIATWETHAENNRVSQQRNKYSTIHRQITNQYPYSIHDSKQCFLPVNQPPTHSSVRRSIRLLIWIKYTTQVVQLQGTHTGVHQILKRIIIQYNYTMSQSFMVTETIASLPFQAHCKLVTFYYYSLQTTSKLKILRI